MATIKETNILLPQDIGGVLRDSGVAVDIDEPWTFFSADLNMWSKKKPVVKSALFISLSSWKSDGWKGDDGRCGITIPTYTSVANFRNAVNNGTTWWSYTPPNGTTAQPRRLGDFRGYDTDAYNPIGAVATNGLRDSDGYVEFDIDVLIPSGTSSTNLTLSDLSINGTPLSNYYLGVYLWNSSRYMLYTGTTPIGSADGLSVQIPVDVVGTYQYVPFLCSKAQTGTGVAATYMGLNYQPKTVSIVQSTSVYTIGVSAYWNNTHTGITVGFVTLFNGDSSARTFSNIKVYVYRTGTSATDGSSGEKVAEFSVSGSWSVPANSHRDVVVEMSKSVTRNTNYVYWVGATSDMNESIVTWNQVEEQGDVALLRVMTLNL